MLFLLFIFIKVCMVKMPRRKSIPNDHSRQISYMDYIHPDILEHFRLEWFLNFSLKFCVNFSYYFWLFRKTKVVLFSISHNNKLYYLYFVSVKFTKFVKNEI